MATDNPDELGAGSLWGLGRKAADEGLTFQGAWDALRNAGIPTTRANFEAFWQSASESARKSVDLQAQGPETVVTADYTVDSPLNYSSTYAYKVEVQGTDSTSGEVVEPFIVTVQSDRILTKGEIEDLAQGLIEDNPDAYGIDVTGTGLLSAERSAGAVL